MWAVTLICLAGNALNVKKNVACFYVWIKNRQEAESKTYRERLWDEYQSTVATRLHAGGSIIIILTRWHEDDLAARLLNPEYGKVEDWKVISLPALCEDPATDQLGRQEGEALWPLGGYDEEWAAQKKESVGTYAWNSLYQQHPSPSAGGLFKRAWWKYWKEPPSDLFDYVQSWDCTFKDIDKGIAVLLYGDGADRTSALASLAYANAMCFECESRSCAYNNGGECRFPLVRNRKPIITEKDGCTEGVVPPQPF